MVIGNERTQFPVKPSLNVAHLSFPLKWIAKITEAKRAEVIKRGIDTDHKPTENGPFKPTVR